MHLYSRIREVLVSIVLAAFETNKRTESTLFFSISSRINFCQTFFGRLVLEKNIFFKKLETSKFGRKSSSHHHYILKFRLFSNPSTFKNCGEPVLKSSVGIYKQQKNIIHFVFSNLMKYQLLTTFF